MLRTIVVALLLLPVSPDAQSADNNDRQSPNLASAKANLGRWVWIPREDTSCRDGSTTGVGVRLLPGAEAVMIYLQGGGACYDAKSCEQNANAPIAGESFSHEKFDEWVTRLGNQGIFNTENPFEPSRRMEPHICPLLHR